VAIKNSPVGTHRVTVSGADMAEAARAVKDELDWLNGRSAPVEEVTIDALVARAAARGANGHFETTDNVHSIAEHTHALTQKIAKATGAL